MTLPRPIMREQQRRVRFRIADARAIDRKQREAAGLDRAEDQHRGGGGRHQPDEADEACRLFLALRMDRRAFAPGGQHGNSRHRDQAEGDAERQKTLAADLREEPRAAGEAERQHGGVDAEHEAAPVRRRRGADPEFRQDEEHGQREVQRDAQRKPHPETRREIEADEGERAEHDHAEHGPDDAEPRGERRGEGGRGDRRDAGDRRVQADHRRRSAARSPG